MSVNYFARYIGLPRGENLYQIKRGNNGISKDVASRIVEKFPQIDKLWLLTGEGQMFASPELRGVQIPYYDVALEQGIPLRGALSPAWNMVIPGAVGCDFAMRLDDSPHPGCTILLLAAADPEAVIPGAEYVIVSGKIVTLRSVYPAPDGRTWRLALPGGERTDGDKVLAYDDIGALYRVVGKLILN